MYATKDEKTGMDICHHALDFSNSILFWNYFHATFLPFRTAYGLRLQVILMRVVWQSYGMLFATTIPHTIKKSWQLEVNCWEFQNVPFSGAHANVSLVFNYGWVFSFARFWLFPPPPHPQLGENFASKCIREFACVTRALAPFTPTLTTIEIVSVLLALHPLNKNSPYSYSLLDF